MTALLKIENLHASAEDKSILRGVNLTVKKGEIHAIMGPNGSGKSTLSKVIMGHPSYEVSDGDIKYKGDDLSELEVHERSLNGIFLAFQHPKTIEGVTVEEFLLAAHRAKKAFKKPGSPPTLVFRFKRLLKELMENLKVPEGFAERDLNQGFSGGEKKKLEILQMAVLEPDLAILDETDSGLDVDALKTICHDILERKKAKPEMALVMVTHYPHILKYLKPDHVHVMKEGKIIKSGGAEFAHELEKGGYEAL